MCVLLLSLPSHTYNILRAIIVPCFQWPNWQMRFIHNQLFERFSFPARFCPGPHHMTFVRKATFRSEETKQKYLKHCNDTVESWRSGGPQVLVPDDSPSNPGHIVEPLGEELSNPGGVYLFKNRNQIGKLIKWIVTTLTIFNACDISPFGSRVLSAKFLASV